MPIKFTFFSAIGIILSKEEQEDMDCGELEAKQHSFYFDYSKMQEMIQPFVMPQNIDADPSYKPENIGTDDSDIKFNFEYCLHRFLGKAQVASDNYQGYLLWGIDNCSGSICFTRTPLTTVSVIMSV